MSNNLPNCVSCSGTGEMPSEWGPVDCRDCGGTGYLPSRATLVEWRARDIEGTISAGRDVSPEDAHYLLIELRRARTALTEIISLAHDIHDSDAIAVRIRFAANGALGLYDLVPSLARPAPAANADQR
jgi:hypothetical protein